MDQEMFHFERLEPRHIRLLKINPSLDSSRPISCHCLHISLDDAARPLYVAISYTWGSSVTPHQLLVNDGLLNITESAHDVLSSKPMMESGYFLWIDAVCINQSDIEEKSQQVRLMGEIYSRAEVVRIWLGPSSEDSSLAIGFINFIWSIIPELESRDMERILSYAPKYPAGAPEWRALARLIDRLWFKRTWVIQEVALSANAECICGDDVFHWDILTNVISALNGLNFDSMISQDPPVHNSHLMAWELEPGVDRILEIERLRQRRLERKPLELVQLMAMFAMCEVSDPRDKMYAFFGIATDVGDPAFSPDYAKSPEVLFTELTKFLILRDSHIGVLRYAGAFILPNSSSRRPSWTLKESSDINSSFGKFAVTSMIEPEFYFSEDGKQLKLRGYLIDQISQIGSVLWSLHRRSVACKEDRMHNHFKWYLQAKDIFQSTGKNEEVIWRTLIGNEHVTTRGAYDRGGPAKAPDPAFGEYFQAYKDVHQQITEMGNDMSLLLSEEGQKARIFADGICTSALYRRFCVLHTGLVGLLPAAARLGDVVAAFLGADILYVIRPLPIDSEGGMNYELVGQCYIHDMMHGEVEELGLEIQDIVLA